MGLLFLEIWFIWFKMLAMKTKKHIFSFSILLGGLLICFAECNTFFTKPLISVMVPTYKFTEPLVSVIMTTYNRADLLPNAIDSILNQTHQNFELIIINDGSTDNTKKVIEEYASKDSRIKHIENDGNKRNIYNRNLGLSEAKGKYVAWIDDDDLAEPNKLKEQVLFLENNPDIAILGTDISLMNGNDTVYLWPVEHDPKKAEIVFLLGRIPVVFATTMWRSDFIKKHNIKFDKAKPLPEDLAIYEAVLKHKGKIMTLPKTLYKYRYHRSNSTDYYDKLQQNMDLFFKNRWKEFYNEDEYPKSQCERLKYIQKHNKYFEADLINNMVSKHCRTKQYLPRYYPYFIPFEDGKEPVAVSYANNTFFSYKMNKRGKLLGKTDGKMYILWEDGNAPVGYTENTGN